MGKSKSVTVGYRYYFGIFMGVCRGAVDSLVTIKVGDEVAAHRAEEGGLLSDTGEISIDQPNLFGGDKKEGGIVGIFRWFLGKPDQVCDPELAEKVLGGPDQPGYRGVTTAYFNGQTSAMNPYPKPWSFRMRRARAGWMNNAPWYPEKAVIMLQDAEGQPIHAMNPAHILYQLCTDKIFARGFEQHEIHEYSFREAADTLFDEGLGLCMKWARTDSIRAFRQSVVDHINAMIYIERGVNTESGGRVVLKLIRADYIAESLPVFTYETGLLEVNEASSAAMAGSVNEVIVKGIDAVTNNQIAGRARNISQVRANNGVVNTQTKAYPGLATLELCNRIAQRDLRVYSQGLRRFRLVLDRNAWRLHPGQVFRISEPSRGIFNMVLRAGAIDYGKLPDGRIQVTAIQDVFSFPLQSFQGVVPPTWARPDNTPTIKRRRSIEMPYFLLARQMPRAEFEAMEFDDAFLGTMVEKPNGLHGAYELAIRDGHPTPDDYQPGS